MRNRLWAVSLALVLCASPLLAQNGYDFSRFKTETWRFIQKPAHWKGDDWLKAGLVCAGSVILAATVDKSVSDWGFRHPKYDNSVPIVIGEIWGGPFSPPLVFGFFAVHSWLTGSETSRKISFEIVQAVVYTVPTTFLIKVAVGRARPKEDRGVDYFRPFSKDSLLHFNYQSFPGGHISMSVAISTVLAKNARPWWLKTVAYLPTALTMASRIYQNKHWTSDVFCGAALGHFIGDWIVAQHRKAGPASGAHGFSIQPYFGGSSFGLIASLPL